MHILFLCTGNSCRSILAEATFNQLAAIGGCSDWRASSAGSHPTGEVHPRALALLEAEGIATDSLHSKSWHELAQTPDIVITVCASAAGETCPVYLGQAMRSHWGVDDPAKVSGSDAEINAAFEQAYRTLRARIEALLREPLHTLQQHPAQLQTAIKNIALIT
jgi:arsenate reductase (thioredoxin)